LAENFISQIIIAQIRKSVKNFYEKYTEISVYFEIKRLYYQFVKAILVRTKYCSSIGLLDVPVANKILFAGIMSKRRQLTSNSLLVYVFLKY